MPECSSVDAPELEAMPRRSGPVEVLRDGLWPRVEEAYPRSHCHGADESYMEQMSQSRRSRRKQDLLRHERGGWGFNDAKCTLLVIQQSRRVWVLHSHMCYLVIIKLE